MFQRGILRLKWIYDLCCGWSFLVLNSIYLNCQYNEICKICAFKNWDNGFLIIVFWFVVIRRWNFVTSGRKPPLSRGEFFTKKPSYRSNEDFMKSGRSGKSSGNIFYSDADFTLLLDCLLFFNDIDSCRNTLLRKFVSLSDKYSKSLQARSRQVTRYF